MGFPAERPYWLLPFRFSRLREQGDIYVATNLAGEYVILSRRELVALVQGELSPQSLTFERLLSRHFLFDSGSRAVLQLLAAKYRTRQSHLPALAALHIFVLTLRCTNNCAYCQVSKRDSGERRFDMSEEDADRAVDFMFGSPSEYLKVEFQGGEPLLRPDLMRRIIERARATAHREGRKVEFVACTNLALLDDNAVRFLQEHDVFVSTSLDGPAWLHNEQRPSSCGADYDHVVSAIRRLRVELGADRISALMTTTKKSLCHPEAIVDSYVDNGFRSVFLRALNPYGFAVSKAELLSYSTEEWLAFYRRALDYILSLNRTGVPFREEFAALLLRRILSDTNHGFVDLQSPTGAFSAVVVYNYDGGVYPTDEARMLAEMGDRTFVMGRLGEVTYPQLLTSKPVMELLRDTMTEGVPQCCECPFQPYCGSDPVRHYRLYGDVIGHKSLSEFCSKQYGVLSYLIEILERSDEDRNILFSWLR